MELHYLLALGGRSLTSCWQGHEPRKPMRENPSLLLMVAVMLGVWFVTRPDPVDGMKRDQNNVEFRKLVMAGDASVDAGFIFGGNVDNIITEQGLVIDLNTISTLNTEASWWDQNEVEAFTYNGALNTLTGNISLYSTFAPIHFFYNKDIAEANSFDNMYDMVRAGTWTWDKVFEYSTMVARDLNGDNKMDQSDMYGTALQGGLLYEGLIASGGNYAKKNSKGEIELVLNSERTISVVEKIVPFLNDIKINSVANKYNSQYTNPYYEMHLPMFKNNQILFNWNQLLISFELRAMDADYGILPNPKFDEEQACYHTPISLSWATMLCVPTTNNRLDMTGHVLDALGYYSQQYVTAEFIDTTVRYKSLRDDDSAEMLEIVLANKTWDMAQMYNWGSIHSEFYNLGYKNNTNFASMWAKIESQVTEEMKKSLEMMNQ